MLRKFSRKRALYNPLWRIAGFRNSSDSSFKRGRGFTYATSWPHQLKSNNELYILPSVLPSHYTKVREY